MIQLLASDKVVTNMKRLYPKWELGSRITQFYIEKLKYMIVTLAAGGILCLCVAFLSKGRISNIEKIQRNDYAKNDKNVTLSLKIEGEEKNRNMDVHVSERRYSVDQILGMEESFDKEFYRMILGDNKSLDYVTGNMNFPSKIDGYPFTISYRTDKPLLLNSKGEYNDEGLLEEGTEVGIRATVSYYDYKEEKEFYVCLYSKQLSPEERFDLELEKAIENADSDTLCQQYMNLPSKVSGRNIEYAIKGNNTALVLLLLSFASAVLIFISKDKELEKEVKKRNEDLEREYPRLINKFALFYSAGMPVKAIWMKICNDYESVICNQDSVNGFGLRNKQPNENRKYLYEEMLYTKAQIMDGVMEIDAYENFAKRVNIPKYRVFISLIEQAVQMGRNDISISFRRESDDAFLERKNNARKLFEEAGTKLLIPMFMMLFVVMVIIMFPAFYSFKI